MRLALAACVAIGFVCVGRASAAGEVEIFPARATRSGVTARGRCVLRSGEVFVGTYVCAQGTTDVTFNIQNVDGTHARAEFVFVHAPSGAAGRFIIAGECNAGHVRMTPVAWVERPDGYIMVGMEGDVARDGSFTGRMLYEECGGFSMVRR